MKNVKEEQTQKQVAGRKQRLVRILSTPVLVLLYLGCVPILLLRNALHVLTLWMDNTFDVMCKICGWDNRYWPLPKASDEPLPFDPNVKEHPPALTSGKTENNNL